MAYDEALAARIRRALVRLGDVGERQMFGGLVFMVEGHMCCGVIGEDMMVRVGPDHLAEALARPHTRVMDFTGRPSRGMVYIGTSGTKTLTAVQRWVDRGLRFVSTMPGPKPTTASKPAKSAPRARSRTGAR